jgi:calmodulin
MDDLSAEQLATLQEVFLRVDKDGDGNISVNELSEALEEMGQRVSREEVALMIRDADDNGVFDHQDLAALYAQRVNNAEETESDLIETFKFYDLNNTGYITTTNLMYAMEKLGCKMTPSEADEMIREADLDGDGRLDYRDFRRIMLQPSDVVERQRKSTLKAPSAQPAK